MGGGGGGGTFTFAFGGSEYADCVEGRANIAGGGGIAGYAV